MVRFRSRAAPNGRRGTGGVLAVVVEGRRGAVTVDMAAEIARGRDSWLTRNASVGESLRPVAEYSREDAPS
jgi:hypothetical protein